MEIYILEKFKILFHGLEAAFINLGEGKNAFIHKKDILPKQDETKTKYENKRCGKIDERYEVLKKL